ncbi:hypothetical protein AAFF_G00189660 [Aldrovandia affinis]|uniref:ribonuclease H n=1 Tax=Aldrovandia affinis TaxID=143900 RepID=A0AAD7RJN1_9TELE|nr:hypothetical protein AAFF_G00189660 [Aldrovandia affinis]
MDRVLAGVPREQCLVYLDDILAHGSSFEAALGALRQVLERIRAAGLKLHPEKCRFMQREVTFLGHRVGGEGIGTLKEKVQAITGWPTPTNQTQVKSFVGSFTAQGVTCRELQMVDAAEWRRQQEQDTDLQPVLQWVEVQQRPLVDEVAVLSKATKGLWAAFESLRLCDCVLQRAWKEPATGEEKWQVVVPKGLKDLHPLIPGTVAPCQRLIPPDPLSPYPQQHASPHRGRGGPQVT